MSTTVYTHPAQHEDKIMLRQTYRKFADEVIRPRAAEVDEKEEFARDVFDGLAALGTFGVTVHPDYGGSGGDYFDWLVILEEVARACGSTALICNVQGCLGLYPVAGFGSDEQKKEWLPGISAGEKICAFGLTDPGSGSDVAGMKTHAKKDGDDWVINGSKSYITMGSAADVIVVFAATQEREVSAFLVPRGAKGLAYGKDELKLGMRGTLTSQLFFEDLRVPASAMVAERGKGMRIAMSTLDRGRLTISALALGLAEEALKLSVAFANERLSFGKTIGTYQGIQFMLAEMSTELAAGRALLERATMAFINGEPFSLLASQAKLKCTEASVWVCDRAIQVFGGYGYVREYPVERLWRDARLTTIGEGTSEVQKLVIARNLGVGMGG